ncbi:MAG: hypothetical protein EOO00_13540 [Chitinophagaceae bacterium]|nr:MAG: hypothetical protein EOO00_13540 [Chitinophagaceae bacterium]
MESNTQPKNDPSEDQTKKENGAPKENEYTPQENEFADGEGQKLDTLIDQEADKGSADHPEN